MSRFEQLQWDLVSRLLDLGEDVDSRDYSIEVSPALITAVAEGKFAFISGLNFILRLYRLLHSSRLLGKYRSRDQNSPHQGACETSECLNQVPRLSSTS